MCGRRVYPLARNVFVGAARRGFELSTAETKGKKILKTKEIRGWCFVFAGCGWQLYASKQHEVVAKERSGCKYFFESILGQMDV